MIKILKSDIIQIILWVITIVSGIIYNELYLYLFILVIEVLAWFGTRSMIIELEKGED